MRHLAAILALCVAVLAPAAAAPGPQEPAPGARFRAWDVFVDTGDAPLAAWQLDLSIAGQGARYDTTVGGR